MINFARKTENMLTKTKEDKQLLAGLAKANEQQANELLQQVRQQGSVALMPELIDLMMQTEYPSVKDAIQKILNDVKRMDAVPVLMQALQNPKYKTLRKSLLTACWQNGLDYSDYIGDFVALAIEEPFDIAFEAFTVVENLEAHYERNLVADKVDALKTAIMHADEQKKMLLKFMVDYLNNHSE